MEKKELRAHICKRLFVLQKLSSCKFMIFFSRIIHVFQKKKTIDNLSYAICSFIDREIPDLSKLSTGTDVIHFSHNRNVHTFMNYVKQFIFSK